MDTSLLINRELSWLAFNARVLHEAFDDRNPLLERLKFLAIFSTNLDEFYMVRVAGLRRQLLSGVTAPTPDGLTPLELMAAIREHIALLSAQQRACLQRHLLPALHEKGVRLVTMDDLTPLEWQTVDEFFESQVFPVLTPLGVDRTHPFPYISNLSLSLAVSLYDPDAHIERFARVKVPKSLPRWVSFGRPHQFIPLEHVIRANLGALFPGMEIRGAWAFRLTRYSDLEIKASNEDEDLLSAIEEQVFQRRFAEVVRVEVQEGMPAEFRALLLEELREEQEDPHLALTDDDVNETGSLLELGDLMTIASLDIPELRDPPFAPATPPRLRDTSQSIFDVIKEGDLLVHHPFESFQTSVEHFVQSAAADPDVLAIKMTLYRTSGDSAIVRALTEAAEQGKQVAVLVELQARFDESNNITWARTLEDFGVHVAYGLPGLKTHAKTILVVRKEGDGIERYVHIGTGNYNSKTARLYTDIGVFTINRSIASDITDLFNALTGFSKQRLYRKLLVAPASMREPFLDLIRRETAFANQGKPARIIAKMNSLVDERIIDALYEASRAGVEIDLIVRGICCLRPGVDGVSERIRVISLVGRFLEHSRIFMFGNGGSPEYYIGSADWMPRNFDRRVEAAVPVEDVTWHPKMQALLDACLRDNRNAWELQSDGTYVQRGLDGQEEFSAHAVWLKDAWV